MKWRDGSPLTSEGRPLISALRDNPDRPIPMFGAGNITAGSKREREVFSVYRGIAGLSGVTRGEK